MPATPSSTQHQHHGVVVVAPPRPFLSNTQRFGLVLGLTLAFSLGFVEFSSEHPDANKMAALALLISTFWVFEVLPLPVTALLPVVLFPACSLKSTAAVSAKYWNWVLMLLLGAFMVDIAIEKVGLHKRIALHILLGVGVSRPWLLLLGTLITADVISMFCSNTATCLMLSPFVCSMIDGARNDLLAPARHRGTGPTGVDSSDAEAGESTTPEAAAAAAAAEVELQERTHQAAGFSVFRDGPATTAAQGRPTGWRAWLPGAATETKDGPGGIDRLEQVRDPCLALTTRPISLPGLH